MADRQEERRLYYRANKRREQARNAVRTAKNRAAKQGVAFALTMEHVLSLGETCALSGLPFQNSEFPGHPCPFSPSIDRVKPELGYTPGNVRLILNALNAMKGAGSDEDMKTIIKALVENGFV